MIRLLLFLSLLPIAIALLARWWFGVRVLAGEGGHPCRCDLARWLPAPGDDSLVHRAEQSAGEFGRQLRLKALAQWHEQNPQAAKARENTRRFGTAVPPLSGIVAVFAVLAAKIPVLGAIAILLGATALATVMGLLSLPSELAAIARSARNARAGKIFPNHEVEDDVIRCAAALAWEASLPPILRWTQR
jgi:hypothetical protein